MVIGVAPESACLVAGLHTPGSLGTWPVPNSMGRDDKRARTTAGTEARTVEPIANVYLSLINDAIELSVDGVTEVELRKLVPTWFLDAAVSGGVDRRTVEDRRDARGNLRAQRIWRART